MENDLQKQTQELEEIPFIKNTLDNIADNLLARYNRTITIHILVIFCILMLSILQTILISKLLLKN
uniref:Uncharacterized protein n=1 Tax=viral metagenome TaxID=1070528 RepID=A0A6C0F9C9_9ZZZZ|tara:strand:+ start:30131 stop:30328 length:198 start_codon:yes stop_codon:yes gene_type:complete